MKKIFNSPRVNFFFIIKLWTQIDAVNPNEKKKENEEGKNENELKIIKS